MTPGPSHDRAAVPLGQGPQFPESHLAEVVSVDDPDGRARVQVRLLTYDGPDSQDAPVWARVAVAVAGASRGSFMLPDVGDEVLVTFIGGDPRFPVVVGSLWNGRDQPTETLGSRGVDRWTFTSRDGTRVAVVEETTGQSTVTVEVPGGVRAELAQGSGGSIELSTSGGSVRIDPSGVTVQTGATVSVSCTSLDITTSSMTVNAPVATFSGVVNCQALVATTVSSSIYTPGAGNIW